MSDWSKPALTSTYTNFVAEVNGKFSDLALGNDPALVTQTNIPTNSIRWNSANAYWEKYSGSSWAALSSGYAISITGGAARWTTARSLTLTGDATGTVTVDGTANVSFATTLASSGVVSGSYGSASAIPILTVDSKGRVTAASTASISSAWSAVTSKPTTIAGFGITDGITNAGGTVSVQQGLAAARPAAGTAGRIWVSTDDGSVMRDTGSSWELMTPAYTGDVIKSAKGTALTLALTGVSSGTYGANNSIPSVTVDSKGRVTGASTTVPSGTWGISVSGSSASAAWSPKVSCADGDRNAATKLPITTPQGVRFDFVNASGANGVGNYAGVMTYAPWTGDTASTGGASYQMGFASSAANAGGVPVLSIRHGIDSAWNGWQTILHSGNYNGYSPTLTGGNASGTWGISVTGQAGSLANFVNSNASNGIVGANSLTSNGIGYVSGMSLLGQTDGALYGQAYNGLYAHQMFGDYRTGQIAVRGNNNGAWTSWRTIIDSGNISTQSVATAASAGSVTGPAHVNGADGWFRSVGTAGWYSDTYGTGIYSTETGNVRTYNGSNFISAGYVAGTNISSSGNVTGSSASCTGNAATATTALSATGSLLRTTRYTTPGAGTWTKQAGVSSIFVKVIGAGGGGGGGGGSGGGGGGGGGGGYSELHITALAASYPYVVGAGPGISALNTDAPKGGDSIFNTVTIGNGGAGGQGGYNLGGGGGNGGAGLIAGGAGSTCTGSGGIGGGIGGSGYLTGGGGSGGSYIASPANWNGGAGCFGGGGGGGIAGQLGGAGGAGYIEILEYA